jgi:hypothetical protein
MKRPKTGRFILIYVLTLVLFLSLVNREANAQSRQFEWSTRLSVSEEYDDNINLRSDDEEDDWITSVTPGLTLSVMMEETEVNLNYDLGFVWYATNNEYDEVRHSVTLDGLKGIPIAEHLTLDLDESFYISEDPVERSEDITSVRRTRDRYYRNTFRGKINYLFGEEDALYAGAHHTLLENDASDVEDSQSYGPIAGINYWFNIHHGFGLDYSYTRGDFDVSDDYDNNLGSITYTYRFSPKTRADLTYRYDSLDYEGGTEDYVVHTATVGLSRDFTDQMSGSISGGYYIQDPEESDDEDGFSGTVSLARSSEKSTFTLTGSTGYRVQYFEAENLGFSKFYAASATLGYQLLERLSASLSGFYTRDEYQETVPEREDKTWGGGAAFNWLLLRWLSGSFGYQYRQRDSNNALDEYTDNRVMVTLTAFHMGQPKPF